MVARWITSNLPSSCAAWWNVPRETEWIEFKQNQCEPEAIGKWISAVANGAALLGETSGYIVWGITDEAHKVVGTSFRPRNKKIGNEELENWLVTQLQPRLDLRIHTEEVDGCFLVLFEIPAASHQPVRFRGRGYIRVGSYTKPLIEHSEKERALWRRFDEAPFEEGIAATDVTPDGVLERIDYPKYFPLMGQPLPETHVAILSRLADEAIIVSRGGNRYDVTNVGGILFARDLDMFERLSRKMLRVIAYRGVNKVETIKEEKVVRGYGVGFERAIEYINDRLPQNEQIGQAFRQEVRVYPQIAIREIVANALIHQDFHVSGAGPTVEIFENRVEITNPGKPLIDPLRFLDQPPRSRNEQLAGLMRRMNICEERGTEIDKVFVAVEQFQLPAPEFRTPGDNIVVILFAPRGFSEMDQEERIRACYQHACLRYVSGSRLTNASLRERLGIKSKNYPTASRIIKDCRESGLLKPYGEGTGSKRDASYVPFWA